MSNWGTSRLYSNFGIYSDEKVPGKTKNRGLSRGFAAIHQSPLGIDAVGRIPESPGNRLSGSTGFSTTRDYIYRNARARAYVYNIINIM